MLNPIALMLAGAMVAGDHSPTTLLIDDFSDTGGVSALGTRWQGFTDRVMGGRSDMQASYLTGDTGQVLSMRGSVRLENNGGFIQVRLPLTERGDFDASAWESLEIRVRGQPGAYYLHLRSADTWRPWQYYAATLPVSTEWQVLAIPFARFEPRSLRRPLDRTRLRSLAVVAYGQAFEADIEVDWIRFVAATR